MEMHQIRYFLAVFETRNFTHAARQCHVSQPSLTQAIKKLEEEVGGELFHRERNAVRPTSLGVLVKPRLEQVQAESQAALSDARHFLKLEKTPLRIGVLLTIGPASITGFLSQFHRQFPGIEVEIHMAGYADLLLHLQRESLDIVVTNPLDGLEEGFRSVMLYQERYLVALPPGHRFARKKSIALADLHREPYVDRLSCELRDAVMDICGRAEVELYATYRSEREDWVQQMVKAGLGFAFIPEYSLVVEGINCRPLVAPEVARTVTAVTTAAVAPPPVEAFFSEAANWNWL